jgi:hypothetical protein
LAAIKHLFHFHTQMGNQSLGRNPRRFWAEITLAPNLSKGANPFLIIFIPIIVVAIT